MVSIDLVISKKSNLFDLITFAWNLMMTMSFSAMPVCGNDDWFESVSVVYFFLWWWWADIIAPQPYRAPPPPPTSPAPALPPDPPEPPDPSSLDGLSPAPNRGPRGHHLKPRRSSDSGSRSVPFLFQPFFLHALLLLLLFSVVAIRN